MTDEARRDEATRLWMRGNRLSCRSMFLTNLLISSIVISFSAWLAQRRPDWAGFIVSLPISTLLVLALIPARLSDPHVSVSGRSAHAFQYPVNRIIAR